MKIISTTDAAQIKGCSRQAIAEAVRGGYVDAERIGKSLAVKVNKRFEDWQPMRVRQKAGKARWSTPKAKKARKSA